MANWHMTYSWQIGLLILVAVLVVGFIVCLFYTFCTHKNTSLEHECSSCKDDSHLPPPKENLLTYYYSI